MNGPNWARIEEIFDVLMAHAPEEWPRLVIQECGDDSELLSEVQSLIRHSGHSEAYFEDLAQRCGLPGSDPLPGELIGRTIGSYRLERLLGRGGMGSVYLAARMEGDFEARAAIKLVNTGLLSDHARQRFLSERRILAGLQHPNVARLFDGGFTEDGTPYFVMEYVDGRPIDRYCDEEELDLESRIELFLQVCEAVEHAHRNFIVHRDLKPDNILVDGRGTVKLLDFGIARVLDEAQSEFRTGTLHAHPMTAAWASPEQVQGLAISTGTDVYGLGLLLYRLLTGIHPYEVTGRSFSEIERAVCHTDPLPPHQALDLNRDGGVEPGSGARDPHEQARVRGTTPARLRRSLSGDLGRILLVALRKEPERRYPSAEAMVHDLRRYLGGFPVSAQPDTTAYRLRRFVKRHRAGVITGTSIVALALALLGLGVHYTLETRSLARELSMEAATTNEAFDFLLDILSLADPEAGSGDTLTVRAALERGVEKQVDRFAHRPELRARLLGVVAQAYGGLGMEVESSSLLLEVLALRPETGTLADTVRASILGRLAISYRERGLPGEAVGFSRQARALLSEIGADSALIASHIAGESVALMMDGQGAEAEPLLAGALEVLRREVGPGDPQTLNVQLALARLQNVLGATDSATILVRGVLSHGEEAGDSLGPVMANALNNLGYYLRILEDFHGAETAYRRALDEFGRWIPPSQRMTVLGNLGSAQDKHGDTLQVLETFRERVDFAGTAWPSGHWRTGQAWQVLASAYLRYGFPAEAEEPLRQAAALYMNTLGPTHAWTAGAESELGALLGVLGRPSEAEDFLLGAYEKLRAGPGPDTPIARAAAGRLAGFYRDLGRDAEAARYRALAEGGG
ncbi:protein kinase [Gemmatimonadota bacterium]